ncbi:hypothetical protein L6452_26746 [Arctium lappa]|uniref:Uncharacterized protein n=1 Tax=Arctium lappa TaxID=4217 RepID=A0ACB8ZVP9_ARCLA|nr:hypothetical protein L6452_26746 [Arctium lappa]
MLIGVRRHLNISEKENYVPQNELTLSTSRFDHEEYYASKSFFDSVENRRILCDSEAAVIAKGWSELQISFKLSNLEEAEELDHSWIDDPQLICNEKDASNKAEQAAIFFRITRSLRALEVKERPALHPGFTQHLAIGKEA